EDAFAVEKIFLEHECSVRVQLANERCRDCSDDFKLPLELSSILYECLPQRRPLERTIGTAEVVPFPSRFVSPLGVLDRSEDIAGDAEAVIGVLEFGRDA